LQQLPEIASAGASAWALPTAAGAERQLTLPSEQNRALPASVRRGVDAVTPGYFAALGASLRAGRIFNDSDREGGAPVAIVNEELAQRLWPNRNPIGEQLRLGSIDEPAPIVTIVGVVSTIRRSAMHDQPVARVYLPFAQYPNASVTLVVRARSATPLDARQLQEAVAAIDSSLFLESVRTVEADIAQFVAPIRLITTILTGFGAAGLLLAALGVFGTMSYTVSQREREMAIRAALGADRCRIFALVFSNAFALTAAGILAGVVAAVGATRALSAFLFGVSPTDPATYAAVIAFLTLVSLAACYRPAQRAATADSMAILRQ
jgi:putative ABC transport system permease protein